MPFIPYIRLGQVFQRPFLRRGHKTSASEHISNKAHETKLKRERRLRRDRRLKNIKVSFDQRRRNNRRKQASAEDIEKLDNDSVGLHINTQA